MCSLSLPIHSLFMSRLCAWLPLLLLLEIPFPSSSANANSFRSRPCCSASSLWISSDLPIRVHHSIPILPKDFIRASTGDFLCMYLWPLEFPELHWCLVNPFFPSAPRQYLADSENWVHWNRNLFKRYTVKN